MIGLAFCDYRDDHRRTEWRVAGFINPLLILACGNSPLLQQMAEAVAPFAFNNKEVPRLQCAMVRRTHSGTQNVFQLLADGCRFGQAGSATTVNKQFKCVHWLTPFMKFTHKINTTAEFVTAWQAIPADKWRLGHYDNRTLPSRGDGNSPFLVRENTCEPFGESLPVSLNGRGDCSTSSATW